MKKTFISALLLTLFISACHSSELDFKEVKNVPEDVQNKVDSNSKIQLIKDGEEGSYVIFQSSGDIKTSLDTKGDDVNIKFNVSNSSENVLEQHTYYLITDTENSKINVSVNGELKSFDTITNS